MADSEAKPPAKAEETSGGGQRRTGGGYQRALNFKAPTPGYEKPTFDWNNSKTKAVRFQENFDDLATYVGANYDTGAAEAAAAICSREPPTFEEPTRPTGDSQSWEVDIWRDEYKEYKKQERAWNNVNNKKLFDLFLSHCTPEMKQNLKGWVTRRRSASPRSRSSISGRR